MPSHLPDRRISRTQRVLRRALLALQGKKPYEAITVEELCAQADVGRSTFYEHFRGKDDLKRNAIHALEAELGAIGPTGQVFGFSLPLLRHAQLHLRHVRSLGRGRGRDVALKALGDLVHRRIQAELSAGPLPAEQLDLAARYFSGAFMAVLIEWLDSGAHMPPDDVDAAFQRMAGAGLGRT